mmetsp:Transcript_6997/g.19621  ORF Transcript_6997/g.19621 Transcript_6997/m.19621 type:complete len:94 (+) Transcript_6997:426-707(+)
MKRENISMKRNTVNSLGMKVSRECCRTISVLLSLQRSNLQRIRKGAYLMELVIKKKLQKCEEEPNEQQDGARFMLLCFLSSYCVSILKLSPQR